MDRYTSGAHAWRTNGDSQVAVQDTRADDNPVKAEYNRDAGGTSLYTLWNKSGNGTTTYSGVGSRVWDLRVCTSIWAAPDDCSVWWSDDQ
ncbi:hypothetical protein BU198_24155 [Streptomyces sp. CBMA156]|nr:hypothetical protein [Streptomyces sp. CBMA156]